MTNELHLSSDRDGACTTEIPLKNEKLNTWNQQYLNAEIAQIMELLEQKLDTLTKGQELHLVKNVVQQYVGKVFKLVQPPKLCHVAKNLRMLTQLLNLNSVENKVLLWSWCVSRANNSCLSDVMAGITFNGIQNRNEVVLQLFNATIQEVKQCFEPYRLLGLGLMNPVSAYASSMQSTTMQLSRVFQCTHQLTELLETPQRTHDTLLNNLLIFEPDATLYAFDQYDRCIQQATFPPHMLEVHERLFNSQVLESQHVSSIVEWFTRFEIEPQQFNHLAEYLNFENIRNAIKRCCYECCLLQKPINAYGLIKALCATSNPNSQ